MDSRLASRLWGKLQSKAGYADILKKGVSVFQAEDPGGTSLGQEGETSDPRNASTNVVSHEVQISDALSEEKAADVDSNIRIDLGDG